MDTMERVERNGPRAAATRRRRVQRAASTAGVRAIAPLVAGLAPLGLTVGATAARADLPPFVGWASSGLLYGASGQLTLVHMLDVGSPAVLAVSATLVVNLQMLLYGAAMRPFWAGASRRWRIAAAQLLVSPVFAVANNHHRTEPDPDLRRRFYIAAGATLWIAWLAFTGVGYALGGLPAVPVLTLITPLVMLTLALRAVSDPATLAAVVVAAVVAVVGAGSPHDLGFVGAGIAGVITGVAVEDRVIGSTRHPSAATDR
jgi:predicted branched-subunit amino acid permease